MGEVSGKRNIMQGASAHLLPVDGSAPIGTSKDPTPAKMQRSFRDRMPRVLSRKWERQTRDSITAIQLDSIIMVSADSAIVALAVWM